MEARITVALDEALDMTAEKGVLHALQAFAACARDLGVIGEWSLTRMRGEIREWFLWVAGHQETPGRIADLEEDLHHSDAYRRAVRDVAEVQIAQVSASANEPAPAIQTARNERKPARESQRGGCKPTFAEWLREQMDDLDFSNEHALYKVTGSPRPETIRAILNSATFRPSTWRKIVNGVKRLRAERGLKQLDESHIPGRPA